MKKIMIFAAACVALLACSKEAETVVDASYFEKGQEVTLTVKAGESSTRVSSALNSGSGIDFKWEANDKIKVTVGEKSAEFKLSSGAGESSATFTGTMPAGGSKFNVQYPCEEPVLASQAYSSTEALPHNMMLLTAKDCELSDEPTFELSAQNAALRLNLWGTDQTIGKIVVTNTTSTEATTPTYTLNISDGVKLPKTETDAQAFFIVVPAGEWNFSAEVFDNSEKSICKFTTSAAKTFKANEILNMPLKKVAKYFPGTEEEGIEIDDVVWAPVNCGYDATDYPFGKLYQWGRKNGQGYGNPDADYPGKSGGSQTLSSTTTPIESSAEVATVFYKISSSPYDWLLTPDASRWNSGTEASPSKNSDYDPCPEGWRVPTKTELNALIANKYWTTYKEQNGCWFSGSQTCSGDNPRVFFPAAGGRHCNTGGIHDRGSTAGYYWSSSVSSDYASYMGLNRGAGAGSALTADNGGRANGYSVRCVQEAIQ